MKRMILAKCEGIDSKASELARAITARISEFMDEVLPDHENNQQATMNIVVAALTEALALVGYSVPEKDQPEFLKFILYKIEEAREGLKPQIDELIREQQNDQDCKNA